jgi:hypothetical protein
VAANAGNPAELAFFTQLLQTLEPPVEAYDDAYTAWQSQQGTQKGQTKSLSDLLDSLRGNEIETWDLAIQQVYRQETPQYISLLPHHRAPFQSGRQQDRIAAVAALSLTLEKYPALQTLKVQIDAFYDSLVQANKSQKGSKSTKTGSSTEVETDRLALAAVLYGVLGLLMNHYKAKPDMLGSLFLLEVLRNKEQTEFHHDIAAGETRLALTHTFEEEDTLLVSSGKTDLQLALVAHKNSPMPPDAYVLPASDTQPLAPSALGAAGNRFLIIKNVSATEKGAYTITI